MSSAITAGSDAHFPRQIRSVDPVETAADKLSAFAWRMLIRDRSSDKDDATIVRHLHDLAALETAAAESGAFPDSLRSILMDDSSRGGGSVAELGPRERLAAMRAKLAGDMLYVEEYGRFVGGMAFAGAADVPS